MEAFKNAFCALSEPRVTHEWNFLDTYLTEGRIDLASTHRLSEMLCHWDCDQVRYSIRLDLSSISNNVVM